MRENEAFDEMRICIGTETMRILPQCPFVHHKSYIDWPGIEPGLMCWEVGDDCLNLLAWLKAISAINMSSVS